MESWVIVFLFWVLNQLTQLLSPLLFSLYMNDCTSKDPSVKLLKFADDTTLIGLIQDGDESAYRQEDKELAVWCSLNNLELNTLKTVEMIVDFRRTPLFTFWLPSPAEEVQPATGAAETVLLCIIESVLCTSITVWFSSTKYDVRRLRRVVRTHWYNLPHSPGTLLIQSEQKDCQNHSWPLTSSTLPLWTVTV